MNFPDRLGGIDRPCPYRLPMTTVFTLKRCYSRILLAGLVLGGSSDLTAKIKTGSFPTDGETNPVEIPDDIGRTVGNIEEGDETVDGTVESNDFVVAPLPSRNAAVGWTLAVPVMYMYRPEGVSQEDSTWITGAGGFYAENKSWGAGVFHRMSLDEDRWRVTGAAFYGDLRYDYYGIGGITSNALPLRQKTSFYMVEGLYEVKESLYLGLKGVYADTLVGLGSINPDANAPELPPMLNQSIDIVSLTPRLRYDTRDNEFYPTDGILIDADAAFGVEALGSVSDYELSKLALNFYHDLSDRGVLAGRVATQYAAGDAPFFVFPAFGSGADLRGYTTGTYRDRGLVAAQLEYRHRLTQRLGVVAFGGAGSVSPNFLGWEETLYSYGAGLRFVISQKNNLSIRFDYAWGRNDEQFYVGLGEAF